MQQQQSSFEYVVHVATQDAQLGAKIIVGVGVFVGIPLALVGMLGGVVTALLMFALAVAGPVLLARHIVTAPRGFKAFVESNTIEWFYLTQISVSPSAGQRIGMGLGLVAMNDKGKRKRLKLNVSKEVVASLCEELARKYPNAQWDNEGQLIAAGLGARGFGHWEEVGTAGPQ